MTYNCYCHNTTCRFFKCPTCCDCGALLSLTNQSVEEVANEKSDDGTV